MPKILVTPENLKASAKTLLACAAKNDEVIRKLDNLIKGLVSNWQGEAQTAFQNSYNAKRATFKKFTDEIRKFTNFLERYAQTMQDQEDMQKKKAAELA